MSDLGGRLVTKKTDDLSETQEVTATGVNPADFIIRGMIAGIGLWAAMALSSVAGELDHPHPEHPVRLALCMLTGIALCVTSCILLGIGPYLGDSK